MWCCSNHSITQSDAMIGLDKKLAI